MQASYGSNPKCDKRRNGSPDRLTKSVKDAKNRYLYFIRFYFPAYTLKTFPQLLLKSNNRVYTVLEFSSVTVCKCNT